ncbi:hypothetical protein BX666DRAFT_173483 [Dichotomocladium elegans]|nr:hypothetical protein BX666DRAFT_173483 [Dichotomocladium elegans]
MEDAKSYESARRDIVSSIANDDDVSGKPIRRRVRQALSCQRCRKHRSKCSRSRPSCDQCLASNVSCEYLDAPGDLSSTALRDRFYTLDDQIQSLLQEFDLIEQIVYDREPIPPQPVVRTDALRAWRVRNAAGGVSIETHMHHVEEIYATLIRFALDNSTDTGSGRSSPPSPTSSHEDPQPTSPTWLQRNNTIYPNVKLSHFTSLLPSSSASPPLSTDDDPDRCKLPRETIGKLIELYTRCLLHGSIPEFTTFLQPLLLVPQQAKPSPILALLFNSCMCNMVIHAFCWHPEIFPASLGMTMEKSTWLSQYYYDQAKELLSILYFEDPNVVICHALCNLVLYHIESGNTSLIYVYSGMAVRLAVSLEEQDVSLISRQLLCSESVILQYTQSIRWFLYFLDTSASHYHNKPYEIHLDDDDADRSYRLDTFCNGKNGEDQPFQSLFRQLEAHVCEITRDIRRTCFASNVQQVPYKEVERIEQSLDAFQKLLLSPPTSSGSLNDDVWYTRCVYMHRIRHHGHWILLHQTYLPTPVSVERCSASAFALVELFESWITHMDCYFRPCVHELKQACEIMEYHVENDTPLRPLALKALGRLLKVILETPVRDIAKTRPFIQRVQHILQHHCPDTCTTHT